MLDVFGLRYGLMPATYSVEVVTELLTEFAKDIAKHETRGLFHALS